MKKVLFVCHGNICRSAMAQSIMQELVHRAGLDDQFYIDSAAVSREETGNAMYPPARRKLRQKGIPIQEHYARQVTKKDYRMFDVIYYMDENNRRGLKRLLPENPDHKIHRLLPDRDIADPWYTDDFEKAFQDILEGCQLRLDELVYPER